MQKTFLELQRWLCSHDIEPSAVTIEIKSDIKTADRIGCAMRDWANDLRWTAPSSQEPIREGHIYGIRFIITDGQRAEQK